MKKFVLEVDDKTYNQICHIAMNQQQSVPELVVSLFNQKFVTTGAEQDDYQIAFEELTRSYV